MGADEETGSGANNKRNNDNNNSNNNNRRRNRGGGGRGRGGGRGGGRRGRGGRGRGGGRHDKNEEGNNAANATPEEEQDLNTMENPPKENQSAGKEARPQTDSKQAIDSPLHNDNNRKNIWLKTALESLGHFDPSSCLNAPKVQDESSDEHIQTLTLWLEDRVIRSWNLQEREKLRNDYWNHINAYLDSLECPQGYFASFESSHAKANSSNDNNQRLPSWRNSDTQRARVVHWLIACATSEAFGDQQTKRTVTASAATSLNNEATNRESYTTATTNPSQDSVEQRAQVDGFPLGFSTGDEEVDHILTVLRMKLLLQLEQDQKQVNSMIAQMQAVTVGKAKPLKEAKSRSRNANNKPSSSKSNHKGSSNNNRGSNDNNTKNGNRQRGKRR